jgi:hypothetical protein
MDYLKELSKQLGGRIQAQNLSNWNLNGNSFRVIIAKDYKGYKMEVDEFEDLFQIGIKVESDLAFSINNPDKLFGFTDPTSISDFPYKVYFSDNENDLNLLHQSEFIPFWNSFSAKIKDLELSQNEGVFIYSNVIYLAISPTRNLIPIVDYVIDLINDNSSIFQKSRNERIYARNIPERLRHLIPLMKKWSVGDDSEREQMIEETGEKQKKKLIKLVYPFMIEINEFLDSFGDEALSNEAVLLGNLAELVSELMADNPAV